MNWHSFHPSVGLRKGQRGFTLVITLVTVTMLIVLTTGMLTLSAISVRSTDRGRAEQRARANARLALQLALGELQALAGPDGRVTAPSSIRDARNGQQHLTGVWDGWKWDGKGSAPDWKAKKAEKFKGWLVSSPVRDDVKDVSFADSTPSGEPVTLVKGQGGQEGLLQAPLVPVRARDGAEGAYAWAISDESQKVNIALAPDPRGASAGDDIHRLLAAHDLGFDAVRSSDWKPLSKAAEKRPLLVTTREAKLSGLDEKSSSFHDITSGTRGLLTNVADGGLAQDLSRLFDRDSLPADFSSRFLYSGTDSPLFPPPARFKGANPLPSPDPSWALLHSHYRGYTRLSGSDSPQLTANVDSVDARSPAGKVMSEQEILRNPAFNKQQIAPVIAKAQFVFSITFGYQAGTLDTMWGNGSARSSPASLRDTYIAWLVIDPVITLWNPYNVPLEFSGATVELYRIPMAFRLYKNGVQLASNYTRLSDAHTVEDFKTRKNRFYLLKLLPPDKQGSLVMQPGEHIVFTGHEWTLHGGQAYNLKGLTMRPGFNPPAGAQSSPEIGGVTTQNLFVDSKGASSGKDYGKTIRTVAVKGGDQIQVEVEPDHADADDLAEEGGKEVTGFLKY
ncbi:MAG: hypothetical protein JWO82_467 [Akkermansiaceae bacterium]|nr:hypothetical protein [Akkermansiaceae bacterium]